ncbi:MAG: hypothetical protein ACOCYB_02185 [Alkalispirochaeta sp.]
MRKRSILILAGLALVLIALAGCASTPEDSPADSSVPAQEPPPEPEPAPEPAPEPDPEPDEEPEEEPEAKPEPEPEPEGEPEAKPEPEPDSEETADGPHDIEVTEELYDQTFTEVEQTIQELNEIISDRDFPAWQDYLTDAYRRTYSDPSVLAESSQSGVLERNNIELESLEDYFNFVVVPSRANARLDDLVFVDEQTVEAIMEVRGERYLLYLLKKVDNQWKIDTF